MGINWVQPRRSTGNGGRANSSFHFRMAFFTAKNRETRQISLLISAEMMRELRWCVGDRADIGFDGDMVCLRRSVNGTYAITAQGAKLEAVAGKMTRAKIAFTEQPDFPTIGHEAFNVDRPDVDVSPDGVVSFFLPDSSQKKMRAIS